MSTSKNEVVKIENIKRKTNMVELFCKICVSSVYICIGLLNKIYVPKKLKDVI